MKSVIILLLVTGITIVCMYAMVKTDSNIKYLACVEECIISSQAVIAKMKLKTPETKDVILSGCLKLCEIK